ncbi:MAG: tyrosine-type recombinase/integrase [Pseudomonadota bacterium]
MFKYLNELQQRELLKAARTQACELAQRDYHWMAALILLGMRIQEFSKLTKPTVLKALASGWLYSDKNHCKGKRRVHEYPVTAQLRVHLLALLRISDAELVIHINPSADQPLVWGRATGGYADALSVRSYQDRMKIWLRAAGLDERLSPHSLRHTRAMNIMRRHRGNDAVLVTRQALNHTSLRSTTIYTQLSREEVAAKLQLVDGGGRMRKRDARALSGVDL